jgi:hypothetical protein
MGLTLLWLLMLIVVIVSIAAIVDAVRRSDLTGAKALWILLIIILPLAGTIVYVIARPRGGVTYGHEPGA